MQYFSNYRQHYLGWYGIWQNDGMRYHFNYRDAKELSVSIIAFRCLVGVMNDSDIYGKLACNALNKTNYLLLLLTGCNVILLSQHWCQTFSNIMALVASAKCLLFKLPTILYRLRECSKYFWSCVTAIWRLWQKHGWWFVVKTYLNYSYLTLRFKNLRSILNM